MNPTTAEQRAVEIANLKFEWKPFLLVAVYLGVWLACVIAALAVIQ